jgi:hypothetical protein
MVRRNTISRAPHYKISRFSTFNEEKYAAVEQSTRLVIRYYLRVLSDPTPITREAQP